MRMLGDAIPLEESRALARRLLEPHRKAFEKADEVDKIRILQWLAAADPVGVLGEFQEDQFPNAGVKSMIQTLVARTMARSDPTRAEEVAGAIENPAGRYIALVAVVDALSEREPRAEARPTRGRGTSNQGRDELADPPGTDG